MKRSIFYIDDSCRRRFDFKHTICDLNIDRLINDIIAVHDSEEIRNFFMYRPKDREEIKFRQEIFRDLDKPDIRDIMDTFLIRYKTHKIYLNNSEILSQKQSSDKWFLDAAYLYCTGVTGLYTALCNAEYSSEGLRLFHEALNEYIMSDEYKELEQDTYACFEKLSSLRYKIELDLRQYKLCISKDDETSDFCDDIRKAFDRYACRQFDMQITALPGINMGDLELLILSWVIDAWPDIFIELEAFHKKHNMFVKELLDAFLPELQFYISCIDYKRKLSDKGIPFCFPELAPSKEMKLSSMLDLSLLAELDMNKMIFNDFNIHEGERMFIISGPNRSGKTAFLRALGQTVFFTSIGMPVPCEYATMPFFEGLYTHFTRAEELSNNFGRLKEELVRIKVIMNEMPGDSIILLNDILASTTAADAYEIGRKVLGKLGEKKCVCVFVTHICELADSTEGAVLLETNKNVRKYKAERSDRPGTQNTPYSDSILSNYGLNYDAILRSIKSKTATASGCGMYLRGRSE